MMSIAEGISSCLTNYDTTKYLDQYKELYKNIFNTVLSAIGRVITYSEEERKVKTGSVNPEVQMLDGVIYVLTQIEFKIYLTPIANKDPDIWANIESLCQKLIENKITKKTIVQVWKGVILDLTSSLVDALCKIGSEDLQVLSEPEITPYKDLPMRNEYGLQVLFNAYFSKEDPKYAKVIGLKLYDELYENWFKLLKVLKVPIESNNAEVLLTYYQSTL